MDAKMIATKPQQSISPPMTVVVGSGKYFKGVPEQDYSFHRPLMVNAWSQTTKNDFSFLNKIEQIEQQSKREMQLKEKIKVLEATLKVQTDLLSQIHAIAAKTYALLGQLYAYSFPHTEQKTTTYSYFNNLNGTTGRAPQMSPRTVNCSPTDIIKNRIIAEGSDNQNDEPIEIQLTEEDGSLNLNSSADSRRLGIYRALEDTEYIRTKINCDNTSTAKQPLPKIATPNEHLHIKKCKIPWDQSEIPSNNSKYFISPANVQNDQKRRSSSGIFKTTKVESNIDSNNSGMHTEAPTMQNNFISPQPIGTNTDNDMVTIGPNNTRIPAKRYESMNWSSESIATRNYLMAISKHSKTGKPSPAFKDHDTPLEQMLDPVAAADLFYLRWMPDLFLQIIS